MAEGREGYIIRPGNNQDSGTPPVIYGDPDKEYKVYTSSELRELTSIYITRFLQNKQDHTVHKGPLKRLQDTSLTLIGLGTIGFHVLYTLSQFKVRNIRVIDDYVINTTDIQQGTFPREAIGKQRYTVYQKIFEPYKRQTRYEWYPLSLDELEEKAIPGASDLIVLCSDQHQPESHNRFNELCVKLNHIWMSARWCAPLGEIGPIVIPRKTACFKCYEYRLTSNVDEASILTRFSRSDVTRPEDSASLELSLKVVADYASLEIIKMLTGYADPLTINAVLTIDFDSYRNTRHPVLRVPYCPVCSRDYKKH